MLDAEFLQTIGHGEVGSLVAVVIKSIDTDMTEAVELCANTGPADDHVVVVGCFGWTKRTARCLAGVHNRDGECSRRISRRVFVCLDGETVCLACCDELRCCERLGGRDVIEVADLIVRTKLRGRQTRLLLSKRAEVDDEQQSRAHVKLCSKLHLGVSPVSGLKNRQRGLGTVSTACGSGWVHAQLLDRACLRRTDPLPQAVLTVSKS